MSLILSLICIVTLFKELHSVEYMYRTLCAPMRCKTNDQEKVEEYKPITMTAVVLPIVIIIVIFVIIIIFMYKKSGYMLIFIVGLVLRKMIYVSFRN